MCWFVPTPRAVKQVIKKSAERYEIERARVVQSFKATDLVEESWSERRD
jgi:hypothetical protein